MTLDFKKLIRNSVIKQQKIQHFECNTQIFKREELPPNVVQIIQKTYGADFLADANYTLWFSGQNITKEIIEKTLFKIANKALGEAANSMTESDFKTIDLNSTSKSDTPDSTSDDIESITDQAADDTNSDVINSLIGDATESSDIEGADTNTDVKAETPTDNDTDSDNDNDDDADEADDLDESVESPTVGEKFVFLKITMK